MKIYYNTANFKKFEENIKAAITAMIYVNDAIQVILSIYSNIKKVRIL